MVEETKREVYNRVASIESRVESKFTIEWLALRVELKVSLPIE